jgi:hypothetical protein
MVVMEAEEEYFREDVFRNPSDGRDCMSGGFCLSSTLLLCAVEVKKLLMALFNCVILCESNEVC